MFSGPCTPFTNCAMVSLSFTPGANKHCAPASRYALRRSIVWASRVSAAPMLARNTSCVRSVPTLRRHARKFRLRRESFLLQIKIGERIRPVVNCIFEVHSHSPGLYHLSRCFGDFLGFRTVPSLHIGGHRNATAAAMRCTTASISLRGIFCPSGYPRALAIPALVVPIPEILLPQKSWRWPHPSVEATKSCAHRAVQEIAGRVQLALSWP